MYIELKLTVEKGQLTDESFHQIVSLLEDPCGFHIDDCGARISNKFDSVEKCAMAIELLLRDVAVPKERTYIIVLLCWGEGVAPNTPDNIEAEHSAVMYYDIGKKVFYSSFTNPRMEKRRRADIKMTIKQKKGSYYYYKIVAPAKTRRNGKAACKEK